MRAPKTPNLGLVESLKSLVHQARLHGMYPHEWVISMRPDDVLAWEWHLNNQSAYFPTREELGFVAPPSVHVFGLTLKSTPVQGPVPLITADLCRELNIPAGLRETHVIMMLAHIETRDGVMPATVFVEHSLWWQIAYCLTSRSEMGVLNGSHCFKWAGIDFFKLKVNP